MPEDKPKKTQPGKHPVTGEPAGRLNVGGKKHGPHLSTILKKQLKAKNAEGEEVAAAFIRDCIKHGREGNAAYAKLIFDRTDGPTKEEIDLNIGVSKVVIDL